MAHCHRLECFELLKFMFVISRAKETEIQNAIKFWKRYFFKTDMGLYIGYVVFLLNFGSISI